MFSSALYGAMRVDEYAIFGTRIQDLVEKSNLPMLKSSGIPAKLKVANHNLKLSQKKVTVPTKATAFELKGEARDDRLLGLLFYVKACENRKAPEICDAASLIHEHMREYGWSFNKKEYDIECSKVNKLIVDLTTKKHLQKAAVIINAEQWIDELKETQVDFESNIANHSKSSTDNGEMNILGACTKIREANQLLFKYLEVVQQISPDPIVAVLIKSINTVINESRISVKTRLGRNPVGKRNVAV